MTITHSRALKLAAFVVFLGAFFVAQAWLNLGTWQEWVAGGLALTTLAEVI